MSRVVLSVILALAIISGTSKHLLVVAGLLIVLYTSIKLSLSDLKFRVNHISLSKALIFIALLILTVIQMPAENISKYFMTVSSVVLAFLCTGYIRRLSNAANVKIALLVIGFILLGDIIHISGALGNDMNLYKNLVGFEELSNLDRESEFGFFGLRYHGWFAEPSYHGAYSGLMCFMLWRNGAKIKAMVAGFLLFILCPSPMMILALLAAIVLSNSILLQTVSAHPLRAVIVMLSIFMLVSVLFHSRVSSLTQGVSDAASGQLVNSSETVRLVYPILALSSHLMANGVSPESNACIENNTCFPEIAKFPLITFFVFFGLVGLITIVLFVSWLFGVSGKRVLVTITAASILSGGGAYVLQFGLLLALLLQMYVSNVARNQFALA